MKSKEELTELYNSIIGKLPRSIDKLPGAGSSRQYYRLIGENPAIPSIIGVVSDDIKENRSFISLCRYFHSKEVNVPVVYAETDDLKIYLQQDLGNKDLLSYFNNGEGMNIASEVMKNLAKMQTLPPKEWEPLVAFPPLGRRLINWDLNYFKYEFLKPSGVAFDEELLEDDMENLASSILSIDEVLQGFMWRDCQSRNVMVMGGKPYFIDIQGGRKGPGLYDAVSFVWQAKAGLNKDQQDYLLDIYSEEFSKIRGIGKQQVLKPLPTLVIFRLLQVLGAYGFRGLVERKAHFLSSIPQGVDNLRKVAERGWLDAYPQLMEIAISLSELDKFKKINTGGKLRVQVYSFSYKKGYPEDLTGNGGGFMFDCRAMHNPGRYEEYKSLTGLDKPVREFFEKKGEVGPFVEMSSKMVLPAIERYLSRGFTNLQVGFGCTGGQHRSVYCAQAMAELISEKYPDVEVELIHREQGIHKIYND